MRCWLRRVLIGISLIAGTVLIAGLGLLYGASRQHILTVAADDFEQATGLEVEIGPTIKPVLWPIPGWNLGAIMIKDPDAEVGTPALLDAKEALLTLAPLGVLQGTLNLGALWLQDARIQLPEFDPDAISLNLGADSPRVSFLRLRNAEIFTGPNVGKSEQTVNMAFAALDYAGQKRPFRINLQGTWQNRRIAADLKLTSPDRIARRDWVFADAALEIDGDRVNYSGRVRPELTQDFPVLAGNLSANIANPAGAISWLIEQPANTTLINLRDVTMEGRIETLPERMLFRTRWVGAYRDTRLSLNATLRGDAGWSETGVGSLNAVARAGGLFSSHLNGSFARDQGVSGDLSLSVLDLPGMFDAGLFPSGYQLSDARNGSVKGRLSATTQGLALADSKLILGTKQYAGDAAIDLRGARPVLSLSTSMDDLKLEPWVDPILDGRKPLADMLPNLDVDLVLEVNAETVQYGTLSAGPMTASVSTRADGTSLDIRQLELAGGVLAGGLSTGLNSKIATLDLTGAEIDSAEILSQLGLSGVRGFLGGTVQATFPFPMDSDDWRGAQAAGTASLFQGQIDGVDLQEVAAGKSKQSEFAQADFDFELRDQDLSANTVTLLSALGAWSGTGRVNLGNRAIEGELSSEDPSSPGIEITGTLDAPILSNLTTEQAVEAEAETDTPISTAIGTPQTKPERDAGTAEDSLEAASDSTQQESEDAEAVSTVTQLDTDATGPETSPLPLPARR